ncbi:MAG TPA: hypothetical protein VFU95_05595 [Telluria sp.]|nr:hypothetical protein [Telluria sp.]
MHGAAYWVGQFLLAAVSMFVVLVVIDLAGGASFAASWQMSAAYALAVGAVFTGMRYSKSRRG